jgi:hypothetical protein
MLPIHVYYAIDLVRERHRDEARRNAERRERSQAPAVVVARPGRVRRTVARGALAVSAGAASLARAVYEQAVDGPAAESTPS